MRSRVSENDTGVTVSFIASAVIHLAVFLFMVWSGHFSPSEMVIKETYYVDIVTLPVADPQSGSSSQKPGENEAPSLPVPSRQLMTLPKPSATVPKSVMKPSLPASQPSAEIESALARLERRSEARREEAVFEKLRSKVKSGGQKAGAPGASGAEAGSRYADYIKSRLEDALKITSNYTSKNPEVALRLTIAVDGRLVRMKIESSSGDAAFELAVQRAIDLASKKFTPPPNHTGFESGFVFKPKGISSGTSR